MNVGLGKYRKKEKPNKNRFQEQNVFASGSNSKQRQSTNWMLGIG